MSITIGFYRLLCGASCFVSGMNPFWVQYLLYNTIDAIPSVKAFNFITTLWKVAI
jgi:hypothetical protein